MKRHGQVRRYLPPLIGLGFLLLAYAVASSQGTSAATHGVERAFHVFSFLSDPLFTPLERFALFTVLAVALAGLAYAALLARQIRSADNGTEKMQQVAMAIRTGANSYLARQLKTVVLLVLVLTAILYFVAVGSAGQEVAAGRAFAFLMGATFSGMVGFVGMRFATTGNLRVASAARYSFGGALQLGYRTGTITGMLTDGLGLLGGTIIFMAFGERAFEVLLGFGFGATLLALFMRVGGGIYTKGADVGADLVGKIEKDIPEDDPRNAATIADNVGDNVGDCAGMAADIFESYEVTIVAAMILGWASFGHKGVIFPLLVRATGVVASIIGTYLVRAGDKGDVKAAMRSINVGFWVSSAISVIGFFLIGFYYLNFTEQDLRILVQLRGEDVLQIMHVGLDMRPAWTTFIGILLAIALNRSTEYFTGTQFSPVKGLAKACQTGHATNIIQGFAVGYESAVSAILVIAAAIFGSVLVYQGTSPIFVAYGVAMCGIGMLTLTGNTLSMDVFGPVADNANGIGEMAYDREEMGEKNYKEARQTLADLDAVGNTTKAITKGIAIGSAVIAAVSLFASFVTILAGGSEGAVGQISLAQYYEGAAKLSVAIPEVFIGFLIGGAIPFLFSSMLIRAVGRAGALIVREVRAQFRDKEIWEGTKTPDYGRVVGICTATAQKELIGPGLLAILTPVLVGFLLGPFALGGFLAGLILSGQLLAVFMANAGGAWDNAKKIIEDGLYGGKGSESHKAGVTGDTVGDPLKDTAGPAINPLIKVMNLVSLLALPLVLRYNITQGVSPGAISWTVIGIALLAILWAVWQSRRETAEMHLMEVAGEDQAPAGSSPPSEA